MIEYEKVDNYLIKCYKKRLSVFLHGPPGVGKSAAIKRVTDKLGINCVDMRLTQMDAVDLRGLPILDASKKMTGWAAPEDLPRDGKGILFLDELNLAPPSVQHAAYQLILMRKLGNYSLPEGWVAFAAGNRVEDRAHVIQLASPLANRFVHINMGPPTAERWSEWAIQQHIDVRIVGFLRWKPELLFSFNPSNPSLAFPTPRSWEFCSSLIDGETDPVVLIDLSSMSVGKIAGSELVAFIEIFSKINIQEVLKNPRYKFPVDLGMLTATITAIAIHARKGAKSVKINFLKLMARKDLSAEYSVLGIQIAFPTKDLLPLLNTPELSHLLEIFTHKLEGFLNW